MDASEEQQAEIEALEAIFMDDFKLLDRAQDTSGGARFSVSIKPEAAPDVELSMVFEHPSDYPESPVIVTANVLSGLPAPKRKELQSVAVNCAQENIGLPSVFTVCEAIKEWVETTVGEGTANDDGLEEEDDGNSFETRDLTTAAKVEVIASKAIGTPVTVESFMEWREKFIAEIELKKSTEQKDKEANVKPTGRQLFEQNKVVVTEDSESFWEQEAEDFEEAA